MRELRKHTFTEILDRYFSLGTHLKSRDVKAVRKTVSGLVKLIHPNGEVSKEELAELVELSLEGRRRVKEQLKKMGSFEFHQTSFSLIDNETREEKFVRVPEQGRAGHDFARPAGGRIGVHVFGGRSRQGRTVSAGSRLLARHRQAQDRWRR